MSANWQQDKGWAGTYIDQMKGICAQYLIGEAPVEDDQTRNTDMIVLKLDPVRVACRVRKWNYFERFGDQFTIRSERPQSGVKTELSKVIEGWGDYILYAFASEDESELAAWVLGDLKVFRLWYMRTLVTMGAGKTPGFCKKNLDGSSNFCAFKIDELPPEFVVTRVKPDLVAGAR